MSLPAPLMTQAPRDRRDVLADPALHRSLSEMVRRRLPESDVEDVVQATLIEALASQSAPSADEGEALKRWVFGIARHKVADFHRKTRRESPTSEPPEGATEGEPHSARDMLRWAEGELPPGEGSKETLQWLLREGEGEKLESIAASEKLPAPRVRQRVVRLRKHFRERWAVELAAIVAATMAIGLWFWISRKKPVETPIAKDIPSAVPTTPSPDDLRKLALAKCDAKDWSACLEGLDRAAALDPNGDHAAEVVAARKAAADALTPPPAPSATTAPAPTLDATAPSKSTPAPGPTTSLKSTTPIPTSAPPSPTGLSDFTPNLPPTAVKQAPSIDQTSTPKTAKPSPTSFDGNVNDSFGTGTGTGSQKKAPSKKGK